LSFFAVQKGCKRVYAVDKASIIDDAIKTAVLNGFEKHLKFIKSDIFKLNLREKADVIIHEHIGNFIWDEDMLAKVGFARDRFLRPGGSLIPFKIDVYAVPVNYLSSIESSACFWRRKQYGIDFSNLALKTLARNAFWLNHPQQVNLKDSKTFLCAEKLISTMDLMHDNAIPKKIEASFALKKNDVLSGVCLFFEVHLTPSIRFSTRPGKKLTSWGRFLFPVLQGASSPEIPRFSLP